MQSGGAGDGGVVDRLGEESAAMADAELRENKRPLH